MTRVSMDVEALRSAVASLRSTVDRTCEEWSAVGTKASLALVSIHTTNGALHAQVPRLGELAAELESRVDLVELLNSDANGRFRTPAAGHQVTVDVNGAWSSEADLAERLGEALAVFAASPHARTTEGMAALEERVSRHARNPLAMTAMLEDLGAAGLLDIMTQLATGSARTAEEMQVRESVLSSFKQALRTADRAWTDAQSTEFATSLVDIAARTGDVSDYPDAGSFPAALSYLLYDSDYTSAFLTAAGERIDFHERVTYKNLPLFQAWPSGYGPSYWYQLYPDGAKAAASDLGVSFMSALANNPQVALDFFTEGSQPKSVTDRQMHWLHDREWDQDQFAHLSEALLAATTDPRLIQPPDSDFARKAAELASHTVNLLGHRGISGSLISDDSGPTVAAENFALILSTYLHGVDRMLDSQECAWDAGGEGAYPLKYASLEQPNTPRFNRESLDAFIALAGSTESGFATLRHGSGRVRGEEVHDRPVPGGGQPGR